jgi:hypothetical protein
MKNKKSKCFRFANEYDAAKYNSFLQRQRLQHALCQDTRRYGGMDICIMPVGAYKPDFIMKHSHMNPHESIQAFKDLGVELKELGIGEIMPIS